jgi:diacylglycerol kinase family enzyme
VKIVTVNNNYKIEGAENIIVNESEFDHISLEGVDYVIISGGDGLLRRIIEKILHKGQTKPVVIVDAKGSFNVIAKRYMIPKVQKVIAKLEKGELPETRRLDVYQLNNHTFLFSAGNVMDALHIHLSEILRFGFLKKGPWRYLISGIFILPITVLTFPFILFSKKRFFIFTPFKMINFKNHYTKISHLHLDIENAYNILEIDGDLVILKERYIDIKKRDEIEIVIK